MATVIEINKKQINTGFMEMKGRKSMLLLSLLLRFILDWDLLA